MKIILVLLSVAALLTIAVDGCPVGKEFLMAFMTNAKNEHLEESFQLAFTAYKAKATVEVEVKSIQFSTTVKIKKWSTTRILLPNSIVIHDSGPSYKTVRISSDAVISVVVFDSKLTSGDSSVVLPTSDLGTNYMIYTPESGPRNVDKLVAIINGKDANTVEVYPHTDMKVSGLNEWKKGVKITKRMDPYEVYQLRSQHSFTGTRVEARLPIAVLGGHECTPNDMYCTHIYQQLFPVRKLATNWLVPVICGSRDVLTVLATEDKTKVKIARGKYKEKKKLKAGETWNVHAGGEHPLAIKSNKNIMVMYYSRNHPFNPFFLSIIPTSEMSNDWYLDIPESFQSTAVIISEANGAKTTRMDGRKLPKRSKWRRFSSNRKFKWTRVQLGMKHQHISITSDALIAVYVYGHNWPHLYATAGVCYKSSITPPPPDPCELIKCKNGMECRKGICVPISEATCRASGDPHYVTFDGKRFDFQGTCTYFMCTTLDMGHGLIPFKILTKNDNRGNTRVSFVKTVTVMVYDHIITISRQKGKVEVNGVKSGLPVNLAGGKLQMDYRNRYVVLTTDFGLKVSYDWNMKLFITVPSSYMQSLGGLCGNYNGDRTDEYTTPTGTSASNVIEFAKSWKAEDSDIFCHDNCKGTCPTCSATLQDKYRSEHWCGLMKKKNGPFASCHNALEPDTFIEDCVYDVCINRGVKRFICETMEGYSSACNAMGVKLTGGSWREQADCPMDCPENSHYEACGTACPASCSNLEAVPCVKVCVEGCQCNDGFVLSGIKCVHHDSCGCSYKGLYYEPGQEFWEDSECTKLCKCSTNTTKVECSKKKCKKSQVCDLRNGVRNCYPASFATCKGSGDPHYTSLDGKRFDFQGTCTYYLSKLVKNAGRDLVPFEVRVKNEPRGGQRAVSITKRVEITVYGNTIIISKEWPKEVLFNGQFINFPFQLEDGKLSISMSGKYAVVKTDFGLESKFDWNSRVTLTLPNSYSKKVEGLCGNWNGKAKDDMLTPDGLPAETPTIFGDSWKVGDDPGCSSGCGDRKCPECDPSSLSRYRQTALCGKITDQDGPFRLCHTKVNPLPYFDDCVFDLCMYSGHASALCSALSDYTAACQDALAPVDLWRSDNFCPYSCTENSYYEVCMTACPPTCNENFQPVNCEETSCVEGCVCEDGFLLSGSECVPLEDCGCYHKGRYYKMGQLFFPDGRCNLGCICQEGGTVQCNSSFSCGPNEECQVKDGVQGCFPTGAATCSVFGGSCYSSFDSRSFTLIGDCMYVLAKTIESDEIIPFSVLVKQESINGKLPVTRKVEININEDKISLLPGDAWEAMVNDKKMTLPWAQDDDLIRIFQNGKYITFVTDFGLTVTSDSESIITVKVPSTYKGAMQGLCGNYNGDPADDFTQPNGDVVNSAEMFAEAWVVAQQGVQCGTGCGSGCPDPDDEKKPDAEEACGILTANGGPFSSCHGAIPPQRYFKDCVEDMILWQLDDNILCQHIQRYVAFCQGTGITINEWRTNTFCPLECPANSHYELCADTCFITCASLMVSNPCPGCQEGCQCDDGFVFDGGVCVPLHSCGCVLNGRYYKSGQSVVQDDCTQICSCESGALTCTDANCTDAEICLVRNGVMDCYDKDPCAEKVCREKEICVLEGNDAVCVPLSTAYCWTMGDPQYQTLDGVRFAFQGTCTYTLVRTTGTDETLPAFSIEMKNDMRGTSEGMYVKSVLIKIKGHEIFVPYMDHGKLLIDGVITTMPVHLESGSIRITQSGIRGTLTTDFGLEVVFDWVSMVMVMVTSSYHDNLEGLCGTYNGIQEDEFTTPGGVVVNNTTEWGRSWVADDSDPFCWHSCQDACPTCSEEEQMLFRTEKYCGLLLKKDGPFTQCHGVVSPEKFASGCLYNMCLNNSTQNVFCEVLASYVGACQEAGITVSPRMEENCQLLKHQSNSSQDLVP